MVSAASISSCISHPPGLTGSIIDEWTGSLSKRRRSLARARARCRYVATSREQLRWSGSVLEPAQLIGEPREGGSLSDAANLFRGIGTGREQLRWSGPGSGPAQPTGEPREGGPLGDAANLQTTGPVGEDSAGKREIDFARTLLGHFHLVLKKPELPLASAFEHWCAVDTFARGRQRDVLPLPPLTQWPTHRQWEQGAEIVFVELTNLCMFALNLLWADFKVARMPRCGGRRATAAQQEALTHIAQRVERLILRLFNASSGSFVVSRSFERHESGGNTSYEPIRASDVDLPQVAASCDPVALVSPGLREALTKPGRIFGDADGVHISGAPPSGPERDEYVGLVVRELQCGKLRLRFQANAVANVFAAKKSTPGRQRKIWDGSRVSELAAKPPPPEQLANPSSFVDVEATNSRLFFSKRDAANYFDALKVPCMLQPWFAQHPVSIEELQRVSGLTFVQLAGYIDDLGQHQISAADLFFPTNVVWPMGFSWSSAVAQSCTVSCVLAAGVDAAAILSADAPTPSEQHELCAVATDDTIFTHDCAQLGAETLQRFDAALAGAGILRNANKDITLASEMVALGCQLTSQPPLVEPECTKLLTLIRDLVDVLDHPRCSPRAFSASLGLGQWFCLLQRPMFSIFDEVYFFGRTEPLDRKRCLPTVVRVELTVFAFLLPLLPAALDRPYVDTLMAADASTAFGFGVSAARCGEEVCAAVGRLGEKRGDFVRLSKVEGDAPEAPRLGVPHRLDLRFSDFTAVISTRARWKAHFGALEMHALLLAVRWLLRKPGRFHHRAPILVDAKVVTGAASKGRSSAGALRGPLRALAALLLSADVLLRLVYIPSEDNPADSPSRGKRSRPIPRMRVRSKVSRTETRTEGFRRVCAAWEHHKSSGML